MKSKLIGLYLTNHGKNFQEYNHNLRYLLDHLNGASNNLTLVSEPSSLRPLSSVQLKLHILSYSILEISPRTCPSLYCMSGSEKKAKLDECSLAEIEKCIVRLIYGKFDCENKLKIRQIFHHFRIYLETSKHVTIKFDSLFDVHLVRILWSKAKSIHCQNGGSSENFYFSIPQRNYQEVLSCTDSNHHSNNVSVNNVDHDKDEQETEFDRKHKKRKMLSQQHSNDDRHSLTTLQLLKNWSTQLKTYCTQLEELKVKLDYDLLKYMIWNHDKCICPLLRNCEAIILPEHYESMTTNACTQELVHSATSSSSLGPNCHYNFVTKLEWIVSRESTHHFWETLNIMATNFLPHFPNLESLTIKGFHVNSSSTYTTSPLGPLIEYYSKHSSTCLKSLSMDICFSFNSKTCDVFWKGLWNDISQLSSLEKLEMNVGVLSCDSSDILLVVEEAFSLHDETNYIALNGINKDEKTHHTPSPQVKIPNLKSISMSIKKDGQIIIDQSMLLTLLKYRVKDLQEIDIDFRVNNETQFSQCFEYWNCFDTSLAWYNIRKLKFSNVKLDSEKCDVLGRCHTLRWLILNHVEFDSHDNDDEKRYVIECLAQSRSITHLELPYCNLEDYHLEPIFLNMNQLELLNLKHNNVGPLLLLAHLTKVEIGNPTSTVRNNLIHLYALNLEGNSMITEEHINKLLEHNETLTYLTPQSKDSLPLPTFTWQ
ncbi:hypothetical protein C9374_013157 [Naegleria lovaniensis]|uniref:Uncharacterized protein n=1 Tax=Naegleria lovaniensis TaxID=51637 RepID=A0AA88GDF7_NAELO|nr:uncharacterized protein C9374_013157 [Naegleria lovaniensis]KAG2372793.1 hypothetical protein C9374_013157 [Naegleria lovaniensis]